MKNKTKCIKYKHMFLMAVAVFIMISALSTVNAANQTISDTSTGGIQQGIIDTEDNGILTLNPGTYNKINQDTNITINKNITIKGNGPANRIIIDAQRITRIFKTNSSLNITFINITFTNGNASTGGAIDNNYTNTTIKIINSTFTNNTVNSTGGAVRNRGDNFVVVNSTFTNNAAPSGIGGAIDNYGGNGTVVNSIFTNNTGYSSGGAIDNGGDGFILANSTFTNNAINNSGGGLYNSARYVTIVNNTFTNNKAYNSFGGAIYSWDDNITIINNTFTNNTADAGGGAIFNWGNNITIRNSIFTNNTAFNLGGGAILNLGENNITVINSTFTKNTANNSAGGAINNRGGKNTTIVNSTFTNNAASNNAGGGIYNGGNMLVSGNNMSGNSAEFGNAIFNAGNMSVLNLTYLNNATQEFTIGREVNLFVTLFDDRGNPITGQNISFYANGTLIGNVTVMEGQGNLTYTPTTIGTIPITGNYTGHGNYSINIANGQLIINKIKINSTINVPSNVSVGKIVNITGKVTDENGNPLVNTNVTVTVGGISYNITTGSNGDWILNFTPNASGNIPISINWSGNSTHDNFTNNKTIKISKIKTNSTINIPKNITVGKTVNITGKVTDENGNPLNNTPITININGKSYNVTTNSTGGWMVPFTPTVPGKVLVSVNWVGNNTHNNFTKNATIFVNKENRNINIINSTINVPNKGIVGKPAKITGVVTDKKGKPIANIKMQVTVNNKKYNITTDNTGKWSLTYIPTKKGNVKVTARWPGNSTYSGFSNTQIFKVSENKNNDTKNQTNKTNKTNNNNKSNKTSKNSVNTNASMKNTGMPLVAVLLALLVSLGFIGRRKF